MGPGGRAGRAPLPTSGQACVGASVDAIPFGRHAPTDRDVRACSPDGRAATCCGRMASRRPTPRPPLARLEFIPHHNLTTSRRHHRIIPHRNLTFFVRHIVHRPSQNRSAQSSHAPQPPHCPPPLQNLFRTIISRVPPREIYPCAPRKRQFSCLLSWNTSRKRNNRRIHT